MRPRSLSAFKIAAHAAVALAICAPVEQAAAAAVALASFSNISYSARDLNPNDSVAPSFSFIAAPHGSWVFAGLVDINGTPVATGVNSVAVFSSASQMSAQAVATQRTADGAAVEGGSWATYTTFLEIAPGTAVDISYDWLLSGSTSRPWGVGDVFAGEAEYEVVSTDLGFVTRLGDVSDLSSGYSFFNRPVVSSQGNWLGNISAAGPWSEQLSGSASTSLVNNSAAVIYASVGYGVSVGAVTNVRAQTVPEAPTVTLALGGLVALLLVRQRHSRRRGQA